MSKVSKVLLFLGAMISAGFFVFLLVQLFRGKTVDHSAIGEFLLVAVLAIEGIVAVNHLAQAKLDAVHHAIAEMYTDYRSAEMLDAVSALRRLRDDHPKDFRQAYVEKWKAESGSADAGEASHQTACAVSLHHRRRLVKSFYDLLACRYELQVLPN